MDSLPLAIVLVYIVIPRWIKNTFWLPKNVPQFLHTILEHNFSCSTKGCPDINNSYLHATQSWLPSWIQPYLLLIIELKPPWSQPLSIWGTFSYSPYLMELLKTPHPTQNLFKFFHYVVPASVCKWVVNL